MIKIDEIKFMGTFSSTHERDFAQNLLNECKIESEDKVYCKDCAKNISDKSSCARCTMNPLYQNLFKPQAEIIPGKTYKNIHNHLIYEVMYIGLDKTNDEDIETVIYRTEKSVTPVYAREISEFKKKFVPL